MSLFLATLNAHSALIVTDTQVSDEHGYPVLFESKVTPLPQLRMLYAATGDTRMVYPWAEALRTCTLTDIEEVNGIAPEAHRILRDRFEQERPLLGGHRSYHVGFPEGEDRPVMYMYDSDNDFEPERFEPDLTWVQPLPRTFEAARPDTVDEYIDFATRLRADHKPTGTAEGVGIGGELRATYIDAEQIIHDAIWHSFPDHES